LRRARPGTAIRRLPNAPVRDSSFCVPTASARGSAVRWCNQASYRHNKGTWFSTADAAEAARHRTAGGEEVQERPASTPRCGTRTEHRPNHRDLRSTNTEGPTTGVEHRGIQTWAPTKCGASGRDISRRAMATDGYECAQRHRRGTRTVTTPSGMAGQTRFSTKCPVGRRPTNGWAGGTSPHAPRGALPSATKSATRPQKSATASARARSQAGAGSTARRSSARAWRRPRSMADNAARQTTSHTG
jgi:hypothetical protein